MGIGAFIDGLSRRALVALGAVVVIVLIPCALFIVWLVWRTGIPEEQLRQATKGDVESVKDAVHVASEDQLGAMAEFAAAQRSEHDSARYAAMFDTISQTLIEPGIKRLRSLEENVDHLNKVMGVSNNLIEEQTGVARETKSRVSQLQQQMNNADPASVNDKLNALMDLVQRQSATIDSIRSRTRPPTKGHF